MANTSPIFTLTPNIGHGIADGDGGTAGPLKTANTAKDGTGTTLTVFTAGASGSFIQKIRARPAGSCTATVLRVFLNNGSSSGTIANNILIDELQLPATTLIETAQLPLFELGLNFSIPGTWKILVTLGTTVSAGYFISVIGGDY